MYGYKQRTRPRTPAMTAVAVLVTLAAACASGKDGSVSDRQPVTGIEWTVDSVTVDGTTHRAPAPAHMKIEDGRAAGSYGCNRFSATAEVTGDLIRLSHARSTRMACDEARMTFERALARALAAGPLTTRTEGRNLTLTTPGGDRVQLSRK